jgi:hypothetical protein
VLALARVNSNVMPLKKPLPKERVAFTVRADGRELTIRYTTRELKFLGGPLLPAGDRFMQVIGTWANFTVAKGQDTSAWTSQPREQVLHATKELAESITIAGELFQYDYQYSFSSAHKIRNTGGTSVMVNGSAGTIDGRRPGQIYFRQLDGVVRDLRIGEPLETHCGTVKIYRRRNTIDWLPKLRNLVDFLETLDSVTVEFRHH